MIKTLFEEVYRQQVKDPVVLTTGTYPAAYINVGDYERFAFVLELGVTDQTTDFKVVQATASAGTGSKDVAGAVITQFSATDDNKQAIIEVETKKLDINNGFYFVAVTATIATGTTTTASIVFYGVNPHSVPVSQPAAFAQKVIVAG